MSDQTVELQAIERIHVDDSVVAIIIRGSFDEPGIHFVTPDEYSQQLAHMRHRSGHVIAAHRHRLHDRQIQLTNEVLVLKKGVLRMDLYDDSDSIAESRILRAGDVVLLVAGGHGFEVLEDVTMIEVKQGPYMGDEDKILIAQRGASAPRHA